MKKKKLNGKPGKTSRYLVLLMNITISQRIIYYLQSKIDQANLLLGKYLKNPQKLARRRKIKALKSLEFPSKLVESKQFEDIFSENELINLIDDRLKENHANPKRY